MKYFVFLATCVFAAQSLNFRTSGKLKNAFRSTASYHLPKAAKSSKNSPLMANPINTDHPVVNFQDEFTTSKTIDMASIDGQRGNLVIPWASARDNEETDYVAVIVNTVSRLYRLLTQLSTFKSTAVDIVSLCDLIELTNNDKDKPSSVIVDDFLSRAYRQWLLTEVLKRDRDEYIEIASFLGGRIPRNELPNLQNLPYPATSALEAAITVAAGEDHLVDDCDLLAMNYKESILDQALLYIFRKLVQKEIGYKSDIAGIKGLLDEGRHYKLSSEGEADDSVNQHIFVKKVLAGLMTPVLPPFYRIFMAGIVPSKERGDPMWLVDGTQYAIDKISTQIPSFKDTVVPGKQLGPLFYAPLLTSVVTPTFLSFLVGPSRPARRADGQLGGMVIEKCKFLQESNCKGLCLHQCKIPAQEFFAEELGLPLTVVPNFETQECQWSFGELSVSHKEDPDFPSGCIRGCETRLVSTYCSGAEVAVAAAV